MDIPSRRRTGRRSWDEDDQRPEHPLVDRAVGQQSHERQDRIQAIDTGRAISITTGDKRYSNAVFRMSQKNRAKKTT
jgi:hypothetical protein